MNPWEPVVGIGAYIAAFGFLYYAGYKITGGSMPKAGDMRTREKDGKKISEYWDGEAWVPAQTPSQEPTAHVVDKKM